MIKKNLFALFLCLCYVTVAAQNDTLNRHDAEGRKHGKWILYLDGLGAKVNDSTQAELYRYTWYDHGTHLQPMGHFTNKQGKVLKNGQELDLSGPAQLLDGEYKCYNKDKHLKFIHQFNKGEYISYKEFYVTGELQSHFDYMKHADGQPQSWLLTVYKKDGSIQYQEMIKKDEHGKWPKMKG